MEIRAEFQGFFSVSDIIPQVTAHEYRGYTIGAWARPELTNGFTSVGIVYKPGQFRSIMQVQRIEGELFKSREQAEQRGVELCKEWIDNSSDLVPRNKG
jgi:hypothetical protein